jgi:hypothetical protein
MFKLIDRLSDPQVTKELGELEGMSMGIPASVYPP